MQHTQTADLAIIGFLGAGLLACVAGMVFLAHAGRPLPNEACMLAGGCLGSLAAYLNPGQRSAPPPAKEAP